MDRTQAPRLAEHRDETVYLVLDDFGAFGRAYHACKRLLLAEPLANSATSCPTVSAHRGLRL
jgi:hypothetical protein